MKKDEPVKQSIDFNLRQLEIFCKVVEKKSFSKAAEDVFLTQPSVSESIAGLENMVGTRLFDRLGKKTVLTRGGELLHQHAVKLLRMKEHACQEMQAYLGVKKGNISIGASTIPGDYILPKAVKAFSEHHPLIKVAVSVSDTKTIENLVLNGEFEIGIIGSQSKRQHLIDHPLWEDELVVAVLSDSRWKDKETILPTELSDQPFLLRESGSGTLRIIRDYLEKISIPVHSLNTVARFGSSTAIKEGVKAGLGISILSLRAVTTELNAGILKVLRIKGIKMARHFYLIQDKRRHISPIGRGLSDFLIKSTSLHPLH